MSKFTHLHTHSHYSLLNALPKIPDLVARAKKQGLEALALTDSGNMYGVIEFYQECKKNDIKPIIGVDFHVALRTRHDKEAGVDKGWRRLVLLAKNETGYKNLIKLVTLSNLEGFYYKPRIDKELIEKHSEGLICISPSFSGDLANAIEQHDDKKAQELTGWYKDTYGEDNFYLEITMHPEIPGHNDKMEKLIAFARKHDVLVVAAHDTYYLDPGDHIARETMIAIQSGREASGMDGEEEDFSFLNPEEITKRFKDVPEALENIQKIIDACNVEIVLGKDAWKFPDYIVESGKSHDEELRDLTFEGLKRRNMELTDEVKDRIEYELDVIKTKGYSKYFLVVSDLLRYANEHNILSNTRGSAAGSLVSYLTGITIVDPIELKLPFERFLNPDRPSAPDIDMDLADNKRDEVIEYTRKKYGMDKVAQIGTFGTMAARGSVRDVARALGYSYAVGDQIAKLIPMGAQGFPMTLDRALKEEKDLAKLYKEDTDVARIIDMAKKIEGCARHIGVHAAGVVISPRPLEEDVPVQFDPKESGKLITQFDMHSVGEDGVGLLKFDFLGLKNLAVLGSAIELVKKLRGEEIDIETIPLDDTKTFEMLAHGDTMGVFQLAGQGMTQYLKELKPTNIHDINAMVALYRPGPMSFIPEYIERKHNPAKVKYLHPKMETILDKSYGIITYQDDILMIALEFAGYNWKEVDKFRKAIGKKIPGEMQAQKEKFIAGCLSGGMTQKQVDALWEQIETFAAYGFNKAHAASYGRLAYQTAYMKANYPVIYMTALLTADSGDVEKIAHIVAESERMNINVLPPDINESFSDFTVVNDETSQRGESVRFGLSSIKNFGEGIGNVIIEERKKNGKFRNITDFLSRIHDRNLNKKSLESLIKSGAMDSLGERGQLLGNLERLLEFNKEERSKDENQDSLFGLMGADNVPSLTLDKCPTINPDEQLLWEKELLGLYISGHPLEKYREKIEKAKSNIGKLKENSINGQSLVIAGIIEECKEVMTKKGDKMAFIRVADFTDGMEVVIFPKIMEEYKDICTTDTCVAIKGKISHRNGEVSMIADKVKLLGEEKKNIAETSASAM